MKYTTVADCCKILDSQRVPVTASDRKSGPYPYYGANGVQDYVDDFIFDDELVLVAEDGGHFGSKEHPIAYRVSGKCWVNNHAHVLKPLDYMDADYVCYSLMHYPVMTLIKGATRQKLNQADLRKMKIIIRPLHEQKKIASIIKRTERSIQLYQAIAEQLDVLVKSRFVEMFGSPITNDKNLPIASLGSCLQGIENGKSFVCDSNSRTGKQPGVLKLSAATYGIYKPEENKAILSADDFVEQAEVHAGDLLFTRKNTPELVGMSAYVWQTPEKLMMPDLIFRLIPNQQMHPIFLWKLINHDVFRCKIQELATGTAKSMSNISKERLRNLEIIVPPIKLQNQFADFVVQTDKSKFAIQQSIDTLQTLKAKLMQDYFG